MAEITNITIGPLKFITADGIAQVGPSTPIPAAEYTDLTLDDLAGISEFLATAWENIAGEEYNPAYVGDLTPFSESTIAQMERDCE